MLRVTQKKKIKEREKKERKKKETMPESSSWRLKLPKHRQETRGVSLLGWVLKRCVEDAKESARRLADNIQPRRMGTVGNMPVIQEEASPLHAGFFKLLP